MHRHRNLQQNPRLRLGRRQRRCAGTRFEQRPNQPWTHDRQTRLTECQFRHRSQHLLPQNRRRRQSQPFQLRLQTTSTNHPIQLYYKTADTAAEICLPEGVKIAKPGDNLTIKAKLNFPLTIVKGSRFALREGGKTIAAGIVTEILPETTELDFGKPKKNKGTSQTPSLWTIDPG